jgi:hypothetical protein
MLRLVEVTADYLLACPDILTCIQYSAMYVLTSILYSDMYARAFLLLVPGVDDVSREADAHRHEGDTQVCTGGTGGTGEAISGQGHGTAIVTCSLLPAHTSRNQQQGWLAVGVITKLCMMAEAINRSSEIGCMPCVACSPMTSGCWPGLLKLCS